jgi:hypothetical protein
MSESVLTYNSVFNNEIVVIIIFNNDAQYSVFKPHFEILGYGFFMVNEKTIVIDGEAILKHGDYNLVRFIEAHEVAHYLLGHTETHSQSDELNADILAYILLKKHNFLQSIEYLISNFNSRHSIDWDEKLIENLKYELSYSQLATSTMLY